EVSEFWQRTAGKLGEEYISGLDIAVDDAHGVRVGECVEDAEKECLGLLPGHATADILQGSVLQILHDVIRSLRSELAFGRNLGGLLDVAVVENPHNTWVI